METGPKLSCSHFNVCTYCSNMGLQIDREGYTPFCTLEKTTAGVFKPIETAAGKDNTEVINGFYGCQKFNPCGLPAHPLAIQVMSQLNPLAGGIPVGKEIPENSLEIYRRRTKYPFREVLAGKRYVQRTSAVKQ